MKASELIVGETYSVLARKHLRRKRLYYDTDLIAKTYKTTGEYLGPHKSMKQFHRFRDSGGNVIFAHVASINEYVEVAPVDPDVLAELRERGVSGKTRSEDFAEMQQLLSGFGIKSTVDANKTSISIGYLELMKLRVLMGNLYAAHLE